MIVKRIQKVVVSAVKLTLEGDFPFTEMVKSEVVGKSKLKAQEQENALVKEHGTATYKIYDVQTVDEVYQMEDPVFMLHATKVEN